ncbi:MAG: hypothetical protein KDD50_00085 [Bdellovibrionales bacterium]|nr:hypothetical protein [Bdellovibrionales bacterium]
MEGYIDLITTDNTKVSIKKESIDGIEEIHGSARVEPYCKIYVRGYSFNIKMTAEDLKKLIQP